MTDVYEKIQHGGRGCGGGVMNPELRATISPSLPELAWAAGFLEGEGSFLTTGYDRKGSTCIASQVNLEPLIRLKCMFGGSITFGDRSEDRDNGKNHKDFYRWRAAGPRARGVMMTLYTMMSEARKKQIRQALGRCSYGPR